MRRLARWFALGIAMASVGWVTPSSMAEDFEWIGDKNNIAGGATVWSFREPSFWLGDAVPGFPDNNDGDITNDDAIFGSGYVAPGETSPFPLGGGGTVVFGDFAGELVSPENQSVFYGAADVVNRSLRVQSGSWTFQFGPVGVVGNSGSYSIDSLLVVDARQHGGIEVPNLTLTGGGVFSSRGASIGMTSGSPTVTVEDGTQWLSTSPSDQDISLYDGLLLIDSGSTLDNQSGSLLIGRGELGRGFLAIRGGTVQTGAKGETVVGGDGAEGFLYVVEGGSFTNSNDLTIGSNRSIGVEAVIDRSRLRNDGHVTVGDHSSATLQIKDSDVTVGGPLDIGMNGGDAVVSIGPNDGYTVLRSGNTTIGRGEGSTGQVTATGVEFTHWYAGNVVVGTEGALGILQIDTPRADSFFQSLTVGSAGGTSVFTLKRGSLLFLSAGLYVGGHGSTSGDARTSGIAVIDNATLVAHSNASLAEEMGSSATVFVKGGARWHNTDGDLNIGRRGEGRLDILRGYVENISTMAGGLGGHGDILVADLGSWHIGDALDLADASLRIIEDGKVSVGNVITVGSSSSITINGGRMNIGDGALDSVPLDTLRIGEHGTLAGTGTIHANMLVDGGMLAPGQSPGILTVDGDVHFGSGSVLDMEIGGTLPGIEYDQLIVTGRAILGGLLSIHFVEGFAPDVGNTFHLVESGGELDVTGLMIIWQNAPAGFEYLVDASTGGFSVTVTSVPEVSVFTLLSVVCLVAVSACRRGHSRASDCLRRLCDSRWMIATALSTLLSSGAFAVDIRPIYHGNISSDIREVVEAAAREWESLFAPGGKYIPVDVFLTPLPPDSQGNYADTKPQFDYFGDVTSATIRINSTPPRTTSWNVDETVAGSVDGLTVIRHEMGHALGYYPHDPGDRINEFDRHVSNGVVGCGSINIPITPNGHADPDSPGNSNSIMLPAIDPDYRTPVDLVSRDLLACIYGYGTADGGIPYVPPIADFAGSWTGRYFGDRDGFTSSIISPDGTIQGTAVIPQGILPFVGHLTVVGGSGLEFVTQGSGTFPGGSFAGGGNTSSTSGSWTWSYQSSSLSGGWIANKIGGASNFTTQAFSLTGSDSNYFGLAMVDDTGGVSGQLFSEDGEVFDLTGSSDGSSVSLEAVGSDSFRILAATLDLAADPNSISGTWTLSDGSFGNTVSVTVPEVPSLILGAVTLLGAVLGNRWRREAAAP